MSPGALDDSMGQGSVLVSERCLIYQQDGTILLAVNSRGFAAARDAVRLFAELVQSAGSFHSYRVTDMSLWAAASSGITAAQVLNSLQRFGQHAIPPPLAGRVQESMGRYGLLKITGRPGALRFISRDLALLRQLQPGLDLEWSGDALVVPDDRRGWLKSLMVQRGYPVVDEALIESVAPVDYRLREGIDLRPYQREAVNRFAEAAQSGVILLPCGSGKTVVGVAVAAHYQARTLIVSPSRTIGEQWAHHFQDLTTLDSGAIDLYDRRREPAPVTIATYQALTSRSNGQFAGLGTLLDFPWGLIIYDEVHSLPADVFRQSASVQSRRRLGLTATLVREDGREREVFSLVGPPVFSIPWRDLERRGWIAPVDCLEVRLDPPSGQTSTPDRLLAEKIRMVRALLRKHAGEPTLIVAQRLKEVAALSRATGAVAVTGETPAAERRQRYEAFRRGEIRSLVLSRVANVGVDLPDASVLIQVSGTFGSRQEEAQRVGRLLRPKGRDRHAVFYSLVGAGTREVEFAARRQRFLVDQGYRYRLVSASDI